MVHKQQVDVMIELLGHQRRVNQIDGERFILLCKRQGLVAEMQTLNEFSKSLHSDTNPQEADLAAQITRQMLKLSGQIIKINRKLKIY
jgi:hypothetical protein